MIREAVEKIRVFQKVAGQPASNYPNLISPEFVSRRVKWISEELTEFQNAKDIYEQADAITDLLYYVLGAFVDAGIDPDPLFDIVHESNMNKIAKPTQIQTDEDGKIMKPDNWKHPDQEIIACIDKQIKNISVN